MNNINFLEQWGINPSPKLQKKIFSEKEKKEQEKNINQLIKELKPQIKDIQIKIETPSNNSRLRYLILKYFLENKEFSFYSQEYPKNEIEKLLKNDNLFIWEKEIKERFKIKWGNQVNNFITACSNCQQKGLNSNLDNWFFCLICQGHFDWEQVKELKNDPYEIRKIFWEKVALYRKKRIENDTKIVESLKKEILAIEKRIEFDKNFISKGI